MKTTRNVLMVLLTVKMIFFLSCASEEKAEIEISAEGVPLVVAGEENVPSELQHLNEKAKTYIVQEYGKTALEFLAFESVGRVEYPSSEYRGCHVFLYTAESIYGYGRKIRIMFYFNAEGEMVHRSEYNDEPLYYLDLLSQKKLDRAAEKMSAEAGKTLDISEYYFYIDDNYLCMGAEIIEEFEETTADGGVIHDHKHLFYDKRIAIRLKDILASLQ